MGLTGHRKSMALFIALGVSIVALAATLNISFIVLTWREGVMLVLGVLIGILIIVGDLSGVMSQDPSIAHAGLDHYAVGCVFTLAYWYFGWNFGRLPGMRGVADLGRCPPRVVVRVRRGEKGGRDPAATIGPQATGHRSQGRGLVAEPPGDLIDRLGLDEDRAEGLISSLEGLLGLEEEAAGVTLVHDAGSRMLIIFWPGTDAKRTARIGVEPGSSRPSPQVRALKTWSNAWNASGHS